MAVAKLRTGKRWKIPSGSGTPLFFCQGSRKHWLGKSSVSSFCQQILRQQYAKVAWLMEPSLWASVSEFDMELFLSYGWRLPWSHWHFPVLLCHGVVTSDRWSIATQRLASKSETSLAAARKMRIDNRMMLNEGACQCVVRELTDLVKGEGKHGGWILAG